MLVDMSHRTSIRISHEHIGISSFPRGYSVWQVVFENFIHSALCQFVQEPRIVSSIDLINDGTIYINTCWILPRT